MRKQTWWRGSLGRPLWQLGSSLRAQFACRRKLGTSHLLSRRSDRSSKSRYPGPDLIINQKRKTIWKCEDILISSRLVYDYKKIILINGRKQKPKTINLSLTVIYFRRSFYGSIFNFQFSTCTWTLILTLNSPEFKISKQWRPGLFDTWPFPAVISSSQALPSHSCKVFWVLL